MRYLKIANVFSCCGSMIFSLLPFYFMRNVEHIVLAEYYFVPLSVIICIWCYEGNIGYIKEDSLFKNKYNWFLLLFAFLIANNGIAYYPAFTCFFILLSGFVKMFEIKNYKAMFPSILSVLLICFLFVINFIPAFMQVAKVGKNTEVAHRTIFEAEIHGLKISQMLLPQYVPGFSRIENKMRFYHNNAPLSHENNSAYLGIVGSIGFIYLLIGLLKKKDGMLVNDIISRKELLAKLNIFGVLLATIGGFGTIFAVLVTPMLRGYNRISVFIAFFSICGLLLWIEGISRYYKKEHLIIAMISLTFLSLVMQLPIAATRPNYQNIKRQFNSDKKFVENIEKNMPKDAMIYQFPYHKFPEGGHVNEMHDYYELIGFLYSHDLRWSYGSIKGRYADQWAETLAKLPLEEKMNVLSIVGFKGIYVDWRAYKPSEQEQIDNALHKILNVAPLISENKNLSFYSMETYNKKHLSGLSSKTLDEMKDKLLNGISKVSLSGIYDEEKNKNVTWRWMNKKAKLIVVNNGNQYNKTLNFTAFMPGDKVYDLIVEINGEKHGYRIDKKGTHVSLPINFKNGQNLILIQTDAPRVVAPNESRELYLRLENLNVDELKYGFKDILYSI